MRTDIIFPLVGYLVLVFAISIYAFCKREKVNSLTDYFIGNRTMGGFLLAMTLTATYISAGSFIGGPGAAYKYGLGWVLLAMIQLPAIWLSLSILGKKFAILARRYNAVTLSDILYHRYQSRLLVWLASASLLIAFIGTMTVQFVGAARLLQSSINISYEMALLIFGITTSFYTAFGGFRASILNDAFQGIVMLVGAGLLLTMVIYHAGGISNAVTTLHHIDPQLLMPQGVDNKLTFPFMASFWILVCFGIVGLPHTAARCLAYRDSKAVHQGIVIGTIIIGLLMFSMHLTGVLAHAILPDITETDTVIPTLMTHILPPFAAGIFLAAPLAAIMSTVNAELLQSSATIIKDLYLGEKINNNTDQKRLTRLSVIITLLLGCVLLITAWKPPAMIIWLNLAAFGSLQAVFLWPLVLGLYWPKANSHGALCSMITGAVIYASLATYRVEILGFHAIVPALLCGGLAFLIGNFFGKPAKEII